MIRRGGNNRSTPETNSLPEAEVLSAGMSDENKEGIEIIKQLIEGKLSGGYVDKNKIENALLRLQTLDPAYGEVQKELTLNWANKIDGSLKDALTKADTLIQSDGCSLAEITNFIDKMANHARLHIGLPTNRVNHNHRHKVVEKLTNEELDSRIIELQEGLGYTVESV